MSTTKKVMRSELQEDLEDNPTLASTYSCPTCKVAIGDAEYRVSFEGIVTHQNCMRAALDLIKKHIEPNTEIGRDLHMAIHILVEIGRDANLLN